MLLSLPLKIQNTNSFVWNSWFQISTLQHPKKRNWNTLMILFLCEPRESDPDIRTLDLQLLNFCYYQTRKVKNSHAIQTLSSPWKLNPKNLILNSFKFHLHLPNISSLLTLRSAYLMHGDFGLSDGSLVILDQKLNIMLVFVIPNPIPQKTWRRKCCIFVCTQREIC